MKQKRRIISLVMASLLMFSMTATALPPLEMTDMTEALYRSNVITPILSASLSHSFEDAVIANESTWIPLHDTEGTEYAYFVPLCNEKGMITGFSVIGNINGNHELLYAADKGEVDEFAAFIMELYQNRNIGDKMIYSFPYAFVIGQAGSYKRIYEGNIVETVTDIEAYASDTANNLSLRATSFDAEQINADTTVAALDNWGLAHFTPMLRYDGLASHYYGGDQNWFDELGHSFIADYGCGIVAAANTFYYMSQNVSGKSALYTKNGITREIFEDFVLEIHDYSFGLGVIPGIENLTIMKNKVENWADYRNVPLVANMSTNSWSQSQYRSHIIAGLTNDRPVMVLTYNTTVPSMSWHWVTITRFYNNGTVDLMYGSNHGHTEIFNFPEWANANTIYKGSIYFS